jgi:hypothetical protein
VRDGERRGVQRQAVQRVLRAEDAVVLALAVADVADDRTRDVLQVAADLVATPEGLSTATQRASRWRII